MNDAEAEYRRANPYPGGVANMFRVMAGRIETGESLDHVLADYGFAKAGDTRSAAPSYCPRCGMPITGCCMEEKGE